MKTLHQIVAISALSFVMAGPVLAQTTSSITNMPAAWTGVVQDKFFETGKLRNDGDVKAGWTSLNAEQQAMVRADCHKMRDSLTPDSEMARLCAHVNAM